MSRKDYALYGAWLTAVVNTGKGLEISVANFIKAVADSGYDITPAEANKYIMAQRQRKKLVHEDPKGMNVYRFTH